jgi:glycolate oxidase iron-sulfur subunit
LHEYPQILAGTPEEAEAKAFAHRVQDVSGFLDQLGLITPPAATKPLRVAYHDACHLSHAQGVRAAPRQLLQQIQGLELCEVADGDICCGSAGTYNLDQPEIAASLGKKKALAIAQTEAAWLAAGNIGCLTQISAQLQAVAPQIRVLHTLELLELAYAGKL